MKAWLAESRIKYREDITDGLENAPRELIRLLKGENFGKKIIRVSPDPRRQNDTSPMNLMQLRSGREKVDTQPRPMKGIFVAITVMNCTLAFNGRLAM